MKITIVCAKCGTDIEGEIPDNISSDLERILKAFAKRVICRLCERRMKGQTIGRHWIDQIQPKEKE